MKTKHRKPKYRLKVFKAGPSDNGWWVATIYQTQGRRRSHEILTEMSNTSYEKVLLDGLDELAVYYGAKDRDRCG